MPTALDYRDAADHCRRLAARLADDAGLVAVDPGIIAAGPVAEALETSIGTVDSHLRRAVDEFARLASVCDERAEICAAYALAVRRFRQLDALERWSTRPPTPPASWVES